MALASAAGFVSTLTAQTTDLSDSTSSTVHIIPNEEDPQTEDGSAESTAVAPTWNFSDIPPIYLYCIVGTIAFCVVLFCLVFGIKMIKRRRARRRVLKGITVSRFASERMSIELKPASPTVSPYPSPNISGMTADSHSVMSIQLQSASPTISPNMSGMAADSHSVRSDRGSDSESISSGYLL